MPLNFFGQSGGTYTEKENKMMNNTSEECRQISIRLTENEIKCVREITKVDAIAVAVVAIVRKAIEQQTKSAR